MSVRLENKHLFRVTRFRKARESGVLRDAGFCSLEAVSNKRCYENPKRIVSVQGRYCREDWERPFLPVGRLKPRSSGFPLRPVRHDLVVRWKLGETGSVSA